MTNSADPDQKPTNLDLHCLLRQDMSCSAREGLRRLPLDYQCLRDPVYDFLVFWPQIAIDSLALFHHSICNYTCHCEMSLMR